MKWITPGLLLILLICSTAGCGFLPDSLGAASPSPEPSPTSLPSPTLTAPPPPTPEPSPLPPEPQEISFSAGDDFQLTGRYYPAKEADAPVLVFMHWYPGDQQDWQEIAYWLQNRGLTGQDGEVPWRDPAWFPALPEELSYAVFTFTFRGCEGGCQEPDREAWQLDARAGVAQAARLPGVNPGQMAVLGASIGADGAMLGCAETLNLEGVECRGAFTLSPGNYLENNYQEDLESLGSSRSIPGVLCLYDVNDHTADLCKNLSADHFQAQSYSGGYLHGMHMLNPDLEPNPLVLMLEFLGDRLE